MVVTGPRSLLWRRLDTPGHDACRVDRHSDGWRLDGVALFVQDNAPVRLTYGLTCDAAWRTLDGFVRGFVGHRFVEAVAVRRPDGRWTLDGREVPGLDHCGHLDLGFTPATNIAQVQSLELADGVSADFDVAWLDTPPSPLVVLPQHYERRGGSMWYESPTVGYEALLEFTPDGIVRLYPTLWKLEADSM